ncbi:hypothetical protein Tsubulata_026215 [Turnera subulata]|uniref:Uncharacterized protein n=1 Tax=Turnera subulata TaxID=218843 RepID=A0A9Q0FAN3_9ROSI|nr:hypothetical protein Tsubulata_026215 [Turnera subulata]
MGRAPCCDKANVKRGPWSPEEDAKLKSYIEKHGTGGNWIALPQKIGLKRCGKSCRLRWLNYLRPNIKHGGFSEEEDNIICSLYISIGSRYVVYGGGGGGLKHENRRGNVKITPPVSADSDNQNPYWPELPVLGPIPYYNQEPRCTDHASIRKLLIKLGGRFSQDEQLLPHPRFPTDDIIPYTHHHHPHHQIYDDHHQSNGIVSGSSAPTGPLCSTLTHDHQFAQTEYVQDVASGKQIFQEALSNFSTGFEATGSSSCNLQRLDGLEFLLGEDLLNTNRVEGSVESIIGSSSKTSPMAYPFAASNDEGIQQSLLQGCAFDDHLLS